MSLRPFRYLELRLDAGVALRVSAILDELGPLKLHEYSGPARLNLDLATVWNGVTAVILDVAPAEGEFDHPALEVRCDSMLKRFIQLEQLEGGVCQVRIDCEAPEVWHLQPEDRQPLVEDSVAPSCKEAP